MTKEILYIFRKRSVFFSIENVFQAVARILNFMGTVHIDSWSLPKAGLNIGSLIRNRAALKRLRADLFHVTGDVHYAVLFLPGNKTLLTIHDCVFLYNSHGAKKWVLKKIFLDWPVARCRYVTTISEATRKDILEFTGCDPEKVKVIPNPVGRHFRHVPKVFSRENPVLLFVGTTPNKNLSRAIEAIGGMSCTLLIVGPIPENNLEELRRSGINYRNLLNLSDEEIAEAYCQADIVFFPTTYEGFGLPIIEGQQSGRAVLTSARSPMKEVAGNGALLIDPYDVESIRNGLLKLINDDAYRDQLIQQGFQNVQRFDESVIARQYFELYQNMLN